MAFGSFEQGDSAPMAEINMVPMIDIMLVLLIIFIVTAPLLTHAVKVELPKQSTTQNLTTPQQVQLAIDAQGQIYWNGERVSAEQLDVRLTQAAEHSAETELQLRADQAVAYREVAQVMAAAARAGLTRLGFVTEPGGAS